MSTKLRDHDNDAPADQPEGENPDTAGEDAPLAPVDHDEQGTMTPEGSDNAKPDAVGTVIRMDDHEITVETDGPTQREIVEDSMEDVSNDELERLRQVLATESARRGFSVARPFRDMDYESLLVLQNEIRAEVACR